MREKDLSPRKMLPSPKLGAVYPTMGANSALASQFPFDLSVASVSSLSNLLHLKQNGVDQPLDLRVDRKKQKHSVPPAEDENCNNVLTKNQYNESMRSFKVEPTNNEGGEIEAPSVNTPPLFTPTQLHPLMLEMMKKSATMPLSYQSLFNFPMISPNSARLKNQNLLSAVVPHLMPPNSAESNSFRGSSNKSEGE
jgi:hypothetical protein